MAKLRSMFKLVRFWIYVFHTDVEDSLHVMYQYDGDDPLLVLHIEKLMIKWKNNGLTRRMLCTEDINREVSRCLSCREGVD